MDDDTTERASGVCFHVFLEGGYLFFGMSVGGLWGEGAC